jgi:DNA-binding transcriptional MocR family regulator
VTKIEAPQEPLYLKLARALEHQIVGGGYCGQEKLPSIRSLSRQRHVSISTVLEAYLWLENRGYVESRPRSGFVIRHLPATQLPEPEVDAAPLLPSVVGTTSILAEVLKVYGNQENVAFSADCIAAEFLPNQKLNQTFRELTRKSPAHSADYDFAGSAEALQRQLARRSLEFGCNFVPRDIIVTSGCVEALNLSLRAVAQQGDLVAVESPTPFMFLRVIQSLGLRVIEIPTHHRTGMDLNVLEDAIKQHQVKACVCITNCHNPLGYVLSDAHKKALAELVAKYEVPLIEDDVSGDLASGEPRPKTAKSFDRQGLILLCSSFSKTLGAGLRVGWVHAGRFRSKVQCLRYVSSLATSTLPQLAIAKFIESGEYSRHLARLKTAIPAQVQIVSQSIARYFPQGSHMTRPSGDQVLWVELPRGVDGLDLYRRALLERISIMPGPVFSASGRFERNIRISCCCRPWSENVDAALLTIGQLCKTDVQ